jgi:hypothetical protein
VGAELKIPTVNEVDAITHNGAKQEFARQMNAWKNPSPNPTVALKQEQPKAQISSKETTLPTETEEQSSGQLNLLSAEDANPEAVDNQTTLMILEEELDRQALVMENLRKEFEASKEAIRIAEALVDLKDEQIKELEAKLQSLQRQQMSSAVQEESIATSETESSSIINVPVASDILAQTEGETINQLGSQFSEEMTASSSSDSDSTDSVTAQSESLTEGNQQPKNDIATTLLVSFLATLIGITVVVSLFLWREERYQQKGAEDINAKAIINTHLDDELSLPMEKTGTSDGESDSNDPKVA